MTTTTLPATAPTAPVTAQVSLARLRELWANPTPPHEDERPEFDDYVEQTEPDYA